MDKLTIEDFPPELIERLARRCMELAGIPYKHLEHVKWCCLPKGHDGDCKPWAVETTTHRDVIKDGYSDEFYKKQHQHATKNSDTGSCIHGKSTLLDPCSLCEEIIESNCPSALGISGIVKRAKTSVGKDET